MMRAASIGLACVLPAIAGFAAIASDDEPPPPAVTVTVTTTVTTTATTTVTRTIPGRWSGHTARAWSNRARDQARELRAARGAVRRLHRTLAHRPSFVEAINLACAAYGYCSTLWRKARCETGGTFSSTARNTTSVGDEHASGLFQFLPSTWATTPFGRFSIWSPYASALAAGWMHARGRGGEWACR